ncbi:Rad4-domain-containing protein [Auriscalpium vulgare]|uniref:Rad4-domain-containing protein n=1 Tax=Auriscalpium vulgare TaxID=40419 RepID=A0ACB8RDW3_9AGAM|nr:Rad4-domain-containing protein [Auriscalpium vulgare]
MSVQAGDDEGRVLSDSEDDEMDWEEVAVPHQLPQDQELDLDEGPSTKPHLEITISTRPRERKETPKKKAAGISHAERLARIDCHKIHTVALLTNGWVRNKWLNDELLQARLLSLTPLAIQNHFAMVHKSRVPDAAKRGHLFEMAVVRLAEWWASFFEVLSSGHLRNRTFDDVQAELVAKGLAHIEPSTLKGKEKARNYDWNAYDEDEETEVVRTVKSLMKHALQRYGSRDVSAQLFTALCRALGAPARLVVSLQSVPWQAGVGKPKPPPTPKDKKGKGKAPAVEADSETEDDEADMEEVSIGDFPGQGQRPNGGAAPSKKGKGKGKGKGKAYVPTLRKSKSKGQTLGSAQPLKPPNPLNTPPVFWTEVFSRPDGRWLPADPIRAIVNKRKIFDPSFPPAGTPSSRKTRVDNRMTYVVAFEEDGYARDVTPRYAREYGAKVAKAQAGGKSRKEWWDRVLSTVSRPYRLNRDDVEDDELAANQILEGMPTTLSGFKDHPLYVLERHLLRDQIIPPNTHELGKFRGEPVYPRGSVLSLKAAENWMRRGRTLRAGEQPMKWVKQRASTIGRKRELEVLREAGATSGNGEGGDVMQGLYAERQTELYIPPPVIDGKIIKNDFGNIDLYVPSMLPEGAVHIPHKGVAKVARQLGFEYAEAVTSFEFKKGKAFPVLTGIVTASENEQTILEAFWEAEHNAVQKENAKRELAVKKRWIRLIQGLRIRQRLQEQYAGDGDGKTAAEPRVNRAADDLDEGAPEPQRGGFLTGADDVVQPYTLPRYQHVAFASPQPSRSVSELRTASPTTSAIDDPNTPGGRTPLFDDLLEVVDDGAPDEDEAAVPVLPSTNGVPRSMAELAEAAAAQRASGSAPSAVRDAPTMPQTRARGGTMQAPGRPRATARKRRARAASSPAASSGQEDASGDKVQSAAAGGRPTKRARRSGANMPPPATDRVLRARRGKSAAKEAEERAQEDAYRRAVAS